MSDASLAWERGQSDAGSYVHVHVHVHVYTAGLQDYLPYTMYVQILRNKKCYQTCAQDKFLIQERQHIVINTRSIFHVY